MSGPRIAVVGLGNLMRADDAVGMLAVQAMRADARLPVSIHVIDGGTLGLELLHPLEGVTHLLTLDAVDAGAEAGAILRFAGDRIADLPAAKSVHLLGFSDLIGAMRLTGSAPEEIVVLGVQPERIEWGTELSSGVAPALPRLLDAAFAQLDAWARAADDAGGGVRHWIAPQAIGMMMSAGAAGESEWYW